MKSLIDRHSDAEAHSHRHSDEGQPGGDLDPMLSRVLVSKAATLTVALGRLMANIGGPRPEKRRLLMATAQKSTELRYGPTP